MQDICEATDYMVCMYSLAQHISTVFSISISALPTCAAGPLFSTLPGGWAAGVAMFLVELWLVGSVSSCRTGVGPQGRDAADQLQHRGQNQRMVTS